MPLNFEKADLTGFKESENFGLSASVSEAVKINPDKHAENVKLSRDSGVPVSAVESDPDSIKSTLDFSKVDFDKLESEAPITSRFLSSNFDSTVIAREDIADGVLEGIERTFKGLGTSIGTTFESIGEGAKLYALESLEGVTKDLAANIIKEQTPNALDREAAIEKSNIGISNVLEEESDRIIAEIQGLQLERQAATPEDLNILQEGVRAGIESLAVMTPGVALSVLSGGGTTPVLATIGAQTYANAYGDARADGLSADESQRYALIDASIEVGTEILPVSTLQKIITGESTGLTKKALKFMVQEMATEQLATAGQTINAYLHGLDEELENASGMQEIAEIQLRRQAITAIATVVAGGSQAAIATGVNKTIERFNTSEQTIEQTGKNEQQTIDQLNTHAEKSKLKQRDVESFKQFVREADGENNTNVFIDGVQAALYLQGKTPEQIDNDPALKTLNKAVEESRITGVDAVIPVGEFTGDIAGTEHYSQLREHMTLSTDTVSPFRQEQHKVETEKFVNSLMNEAEQNASEYVEAQEIFTTVKNQLVDTGMVNESNASLMAQVVPAWATAQAKRSGRSVAEVYQSAGLTIDGPQTGEMGRLTGEVLTQMNDEPVQLELIQPDPVEVQDRLGESQAADRRSTDSEVQQDNRKGDRRRDDARRAKIEAMTAEEKYAAIYQHELTGLNNRRAFEEDIPDSPVIVSIDVDSLKTVNDNLGHDSGDELLKVVGYALHKHLGGNAYHISGDEFFILGDNKEDIDTKIKAAQEDLKSTVVSSDRGTMNGVSFTAGFGVDKESADHAMEQGKAEREKSGERVGRGEIPPSMTLNEVFNQSSVDQTQTEEFKNWSGDGEIVESEDINQHIFENGTPTILKVFHGTTHDFSVFDALRGNLEGQFGAVNYFTSSESDATGNYAGVGPDLTNRIDGRILQLQDSITEQFDEKGRDEVLQSLHRSLDDLRFISGKMADMNDTDAVEWTAEIIANRELNGGQDQTLELFVRVDNPFVIGENAQWIEFVDDETTYNEAVERVADDQGVSVEDVKNEIDEYEDLIDEVRWEIQSEQENPLVDAINTVAQRHDVDVSNVINEVYELGENATPDTIEQLMRNNEDFSYAENQESGGLIGSQLIGEVIQEMGFDSIILRDADSRFPTMNMEPETTHVHVFDAGKTNIKSVENQGTFNPDDPNIFNQKTITGVRGYYDPSNTVIRLTEAADLSTFLHEFAHFMYEMEATGKTELNESINNWYKRNAEDVAAEANSYLGEDFSELKQSQSPMIENRKRQIHFEIEALKEKFTKLEIDDPNRKKVKADLQKLRDEFTQLSESRVRKYKPTENQINAEYNSPYDIPTEVMEWAVVNLSIIESDASTDLVRWARIHGTADDDRLSGDVTVYRAVSESDEIRPGDWVTINRQYAEDHLLRNLQHGDILEETVNGEDVLLSPTGDVDELIYAPLQLSQGFSESSQLFAQSAMQTVEQLKNEISQIDGIKTIDIFESGDRVKLGTIIVDKDSRKSGVGTDALERIVSWADANGKTVSLSPAIRDDFQGTTSRSRLVKFYKRFGFVENKGRNKDFTISERMYREPKQVLNQTTPPTGEKGAITANNVIEFLDIGSTGDKDKDAALRRAVHEQFARGFETYLMEGKAPSIELRNAFRTFARWLAQIYQSMRGQLNVKLDDEMRQVFDRLLATEEQIAAAESRARMEPMFTDAAMAGMSEDEFKKYKERQEKVKDVQSETLRDKMIAALTRKTKAWWKEEKADIIDTVTDELKTEKVHNARSTLKNTELKLDTATVKEMVGEQVTDKLGRKSTRIPSKLRGMTAKGQLGVHPDEAAVFLGYDSGAELINDIIESDSLKDAAEREAEKQMLERHGDVFNDGTIEQEADEAIQNEERGKLILTELKALSKGTNQRVLDRQTLKSIAKDKIAKLSFREIHPGKYRKAEILAAQEATALLAKGNKEGAAQAKLRQVMNYYLGMEATEAKNETTKIVDRMTRYNKKKVREEIQKAEGGYWEQIVKILNRFEFRKSATLSSVDRVNQDVNTWATERMEVDGAGLTLHDAVLNESYVTHWKNVPYSDLQGVSDSVKNIEHVARYSNKITRLGEEIEYDKLVAKLTTAAESTDAGRFKVSASKADDPNWLSKHGRWAMAQMTKIPWMMRWMDGHDNTGVWFTTFAQPFTDALDAKYKLFGEVGTPVLDMIKNRSKEDRKRHNRKLFIPEIKGTGDGTHTGSMMGHEVLAVALNTGNEGNLRKLLLGEGWVDPNDDSTISFDNPKLQAVLAHMTESDWQLVQNIWDQIDKLYPMLAEVHRKTTGLTPPKVEATPIQTEHGEFRGGYYPVKYDPRRDSRAAENEDRMNAEVESMFSGAASLQATVNAGATNERTGYYAPMELSLDVVGNHLQETIHYITHHDAVREVNKLLRDPRVKKSVVEKLGPQEFAQLKPWLNDVAKDGRNSPANSFIDRMFNRLRMGTTLGVMGFKASTGIIQISGLSNAIAEVGLTPMTQALRTVLGSPSTIHSAWEFASSRSKVLDHRTQTMDREMRNALEQLADKRGLMTKVQEVSMQHIALIQTYMVDLPTWHGAYTKELNDSGDEAKAIQYADQVVENVHGSGATKDMAALMRNRTKTHTIFTMFMTFFSALWNAQRDTVKGARIGKYSVTTTAAKVMFMVTIPVLFEMLMRGEFGEDEELEDTLQDVMVKTTMFPVQSVPFVRDVVNGVFSGYGYTASPITGMIERGLQGAEGMSDGDATLSNWKNATKLLGAAGKIPGVSQAWATSEHLYDVLEEGEELTMHQLLFGPERD